MRNDKHLAIKLRKEGKSYNEISQEVGIPKARCVIGFAIYGGLGSLKKNLLKKQFRKLQNK